MKTNAKAALRTLSALTLSTCVLTAAPGIAGEDVRFESKTSARQGLFLGLNAGGAGSQLMYKDGTRRISEEPLAGGLGQLRVGYNLSPKFAVGLETIGFDSKEDDADWELGAALAAVTWRPCANGFFLRAGLGVGGGDFTDPLTGQQHSVDGRAAGLFGVGYEWRLGEHAGLGLAADGVGFDANGATGFEEDHVGAGGATIQFNWYL